MFLVILQALFFFLPAYFANATPVIAARFKWFEFLNVPVDGGKKLSDGEFIFGTTKTWRGIFLGGIAGMITALLQATIFHVVPASHFLYLFSYNWGFSGLLGFLLGMGEGLGDLFKSFVKRRLHRRSSAPFFGFDQLSFLGALGLSFFVYIPPLLHLIFIAAFAIFIPIIANIIAYRLGWKKVWW